MVRFGAAAMSFAKSKISWHPSGMCQNFTRTSFGVGGGYGTASLAWKYAKKKHPTRDPSSIPAAVPVFWTGGSQGFGHAAVSLGGGYCRSTDWPRRYAVGTARISDIEKYWGHRLAGWTEDINQVTVYHPKPSGPVLDLSLVITAARGERLCPNGIKLKQAVAEEVGKGEMQYNNSRLGDGFRTQYALVQKKYLRGETIKPGDANGIPGMSSLMWLGQRHGFSVKA